MMKHWMAVRLFRVSYKHIGSKYFCKFASGKIDTLEETHEMINDELKYIKELNINEYHQKHNQTDKIESIFN